MRARAAGRLVACVWLVAVVLLYFKPSLLPGLKEFFSLPGAPTVRGVFASIGHLAAAAAVFAVAWGIGRALVLLALRSGRLALGIEAPLLLFTTMSALGLGVLSFLALALALIGLLLPVVLWVIIFTGLVVAALHALRQPLRRPSMPQGGVE